MKIYVRPSDYMACGHYRLIWPAEALAGEHNIEVARRWTVGVEPHTANVGRSLAGIWEADADVVVLQRPTDKRIAEAIPVLRSRGIAVVIDMDDDLTCVHPKNHAYRHAEMYKDNAAKACAAATLVTVTTPALAQRYGGHGRVRIIPNCVPKSYLDVPHKDSATIGWAGTIGTNPDGLQEIGPVIAKLMDEGSRFKVVGPPDKVRETLGLRKSFRSTGYVTLRNWPIELARLGIGVAPLADTEFNAAKSRLRPLQFAAVGVPWIGSPADDYKALWQQGCGLLAETPEEWDKHLRELTKSPSLRYEMSEAGREVAKSNTIEGNAHWWAEAWDEALQIERRQNRRARRR